MYYTMGVLVHASASAQILPGSLVSPQSLDTTGCTTSTPIIIRRVLCTRGAADAGWCTTWRWRFRTLWGTACTGTVHLLQTHMNKASATLVRTVHGTSWWRSCPTGSSWLGPLLVADRHTW